jgi:hypothetical protein
MPQRAVLIRAAARFSFGLPWLVLFLQDQDVIWQSDPNSVWVVSLSANKNFGGPVRLP